MGDDRAEPVAVGAQLDHVRPGAAETSSCCCTTWTPAASANLRCTAAVTRTSRVRPVDGSDTVTRPIGGTFALARVVDRDRQDVVPQPEPGQRVDPRVAAEVGDDRDESPSLAQPRDAVDRTGQVAAAEMLGRGRRARCW